MKWVNLAVIPHFSWPNVSVQMQFEGRLIVLQPLTDELSCTVSVFEDRGLSFEVGGSILCHYLSCLAWSMEGGIVELFITGSNNPKKPGRLGRGTYGQAGHTQSKPWEFLYLPQPVSEEAKLSLALFASVATS